MCDMSDLGRLGDRCVQRTRLVRGLVFLSHRLVRASILDFVLDGNTTYCWKVGASIYTSSVDGSASVSSSSGDGCALTLAIDFPTTTVYAYDSVDVAWNATLRLAASGNSTTFLSNTFDVDELFVGLDRVSQRYYQVVHSRLHTCEYGSSDCSPVSGSSQQADNTSNIVGNFSDAGVVAFSSSELVFSEPGNYTLLAHLILPGEVPTSERYDYAVFTKVEILSRASTTATTQPYTESSSTSSASSKAGMSTQVVCVIIISGIVAVAMFAIGITTLRSKKNNDSGDEDDALDRRATAAKSNKRCGLPFERQTGVNQQPTPIAWGDSALEENEFAMLSVHEATMSRPRNGGGGTFLSALGRPSAQQATNSRPSPVPFVGPTCRQSIKRKPGYGGVEFEIGGGGSDRQGITETPTSGRANYSDMDPTPRPVPLAGRPSRPSMAPHRPSTKIMFNDIEEDDVAAGEPRVLPTASELHLGATAVDLDLTRVSRRIKHAISEDDKESWRSQQKLTADDLRETETKGPSLALSDLGLMRGAMRGPDFD